MSAPQTSRNLGDLQPGMRERAEQLLAQADAAGIPLTVTATLRPMAVQAALYAQGRTTPGPVVTNARPGSSYHNYGLAIDVVPTALLGLPNWGDTPAHEAATDALWHRLGTIGEGVGLRWGGWFQHLRDRPHFEWSGGLTLAQLAIGMRPTAPSAMVADLNKQKG